MLVRNYDPPTRHPVTDMDKVLSYKRRQKLVIRACFHETSFGLVLTNNNVKSPSQSKTYWELLSELQRSATRASRAWTSRLGDIQGRGWVTPEKFGGLPHVFTFWLWTQGQGAVAGKWSRTHINYIWHTVSLRAETIPEALAKFWRLLGSLNLVLGYTVRKLRSIAFQRCIWRGGLLLAEMGENEDFLHKTA